MYHYLYNINQASEHKKTRKRSLAAAGINPACSQNLCARPPAHVQRQRQTRMAVREKETRARRQHAADSVGPDRQIRQPYGRAPCREHEIDRARCQPPSIVDPAFNEIRLTPCLRRKAPSDVQRLAREVEPG